jgi:hypothetical protein
VVTTTYRWRLQRYLDQNAVEAGLVRDPRTYRLGSARLYCLERRPLWLDTSWLDERIDSVDGGSRVEKYGRLLGARLEPWELALVESRLASPATREDGLDDLVGGLPAHVLDWLRRRAVLADGPTPVFPYAPAELLLPILQQVLPPLEGPRPRPGGRDRHDLLAVGLLRQVAGLRFSEIARRFGIAASTVQLRYAEHVRLLVHDPDYARVAADCTARCLARLAPP